MLRSPHLAWCILPLLAACGWEEPPPTAPTAHQARTSRTAIIDVDGPAIVEVGAPVHLSVSTTSAPLGGSIDVTIDGVEARLAEPTFDQPGTYDIVIQATTNDPLGGRSVDEVTHRVEVVEPAFSVACGLEPGSAYVVRCRATDGGEPAVARAFTWTLDSDRVVTSGATGATTTFDVADAMNHGAVATDFDVTVVDSLGRSATTSVSLGSHVFLGRQHGLLTPLVASEIEESCPIVVDFEVTNPTTDAAVTFTRFVKRTHSCDPAVAPWAADVSLQALFGRDYPAPPLGPDRNPAGPGTLELRPGETARGALTIPCDSVAPDACATEYALVGRSDLGEHVQSSLWIPHDDPSRATQASRVTAATLDALLDAGLLTDPNRVDETELMALEATGHVGRTSSGWEMN